MGVYSRIVLPRLLDFAMTMPELGSHRRQLLGTVTGNVLEIGFGTGANLPYYPKHIKKLTAIDANEGMTPFAKKRVAARGMEVDHRVLNAESLPFPDDSFDSVVTTWTLCSVGAVERALGEIRRVLKPEGKLFFLEHGLSPDARVKKLQQLLNPVNQVIAGGCRLTRDMASLVKDAGFSIETLEHYYIDKVPKTHGYMYQGLARKHS